jgi:pimeloyl-ACP methyl ester carboxylesterase
MFACILQQNIKASCRPSIGRIRIPSGGSMQIAIYIFSLILVLFTVAGTAQAEEHTLTYNGLTLNANLERAVDRSISSDGVILITHGGLMHRDMEAIVYLQGLLKEHGYNTLAINLSLGLDNRHGMYDCRVTHRHRNTDAVDEIGIWVNWLKTQGARHVILLGHSRGGAQTALFAAEHDSDLIQAVVLMAPATSANTDAAAYQQRYNAPLAPVLVKAQNLVKDHHGDSVMPHTGLMNCADTSVTANAFLSYYGPQARVDTPDLIPKLRKPTLVIVAGNDEIVVGLDKKITPLTDGKHVQMKIVEGADHTFRDLYADDAVEAIDAFVKGIDAKEALDSKNKNGNERNTETGMNQSIQ